jgi:hypothetical protein
MTGPSLAGVEDRKAGTLASFQRYSPALKSSEVPSESKELLRSACWTDGCPDICQSPVGEPAATFRPDGLIAGAA